jgi:hypothetical protein
LIVSVIKSKVKRACLVPPFNRILHWRGLHTTNVGKWAQAYKGLESPEPYDDVFTYEVAAQFLEPCELVEDWGCGKGWARTIFDASRYRGVDGSRTPFTDVVADLVNYRSKVPGILIRHVLEHNYRWAEILDNALASFCERMVLVIFTPLSEKTRAIAYNPHIGVPDIAFKLEDITDRFGPEVEARWASYPTSTEYGREVVFFLSRTAPPVRG